MFWQKQRTVDRHPGTPGVVVLLADRSTSMASCALRKTAEALPHFAHAIPGLRAFAFHADLVASDTRKPESLMYASPARGTHKSGGHYCNSTYLGYCMEKIAHLKPSKTIVLSDGGVADMKRALAAADNMTGDIEAYFCPSSWQDEGFMRELARRGRGKFARLDPSTSDFHQELITSLRIRRFIHERLPDLHIYPGDR